MTPTGVHIVTSKRPGKPIRHYIYAWRGGPLVRVAAQAAKPRLTPDDMAAIADAHASARAMPADLVPGVIARLRRSRYWLGLSIQTRRVWSPALDKIEAKWPDVPLKVFADPRMTPRFLAWQRSMDHAPRSADIAITVLRALLEWARLEGLITSNPAAGIAPIYRRQDRAAVIWTDQDIAALAQHALPQLVDAVELGALTGLRRADLVALRWDEIDDLAIRRMAAKRSRGKRFRATIPRLPALSQLLERIRARPRKPGVETVLVNSYGQSWSGEGLASSFHDARAKANDGSGIWHSERDPATGEELRIAKRLHDLRGTFVTRLMLHPTARLTDPEIAGLMAWSDHQVAEIRRRYVDDTAIIMALATRLADPAVKQPVKRQRKNQLSN